MFVSMGAGLPTGTGFGLLGEVKLGSAGAVLVELEENVGMKIVLSPLLRVSSLSLPVFELIGHFLAWSLCRPWHLGGSGEPLILPVKILVFSSDFVFDFCFSC